MKFRTSCSRVGLVLVMLVGGAGWVGRSVAADPIPPATRLVISSFKVTSDSKFITLYNPTGIPVNLGNVTLNYYTYDMAKDTDSAPVTYHVTGISSTHSLQLAGVLQPDGYYVVSDGLLTMCYQAAINSASLSFSTTAGSLQVVDANATDGMSVTVSPTVDDSIGWAKYAASNVLGMHLLPDNSDAFLRRNLENGEWQDVIPADAGDACNLSQLMVEPAAETVTLTDDWQLPDDPDIPASIISLAADGTGAVAPAVPANDIGLVAPQITELLPNPAGTGTDGTDEFIELYNPNSRAFDLTGFVLQTGLTTKHSYMFPAGSLLQPKAFAAFYSVNTHLSLSNAGGQADLTDPIGKVISQTGSYGSAKDGQAWAVAKGTWYWTAKPTPGVANVINQTASIKTSSAKQVAAAIKGASTTKSPLQSAASKSAAVEAEASAPNHPYVLVALAVLAVGYGVYEYRHDIANKLHQLRANRKAR